MPEHKNNICSQKLREIERLGAVHVGYGDDQCVQCGGIRVAKSTLCAECLVGEQKSLLIKSMAYESEIKKLKKRLKKAIALGARLLDHISSEAVYVSELRLELWKAKGIIKGG